MNLTLNRDQPYDEFIREQIAGDEFEESRGLVNCPWQRPRRSWH